MANESTRQVVHFADFFVDDTKSGVRIPQSKYASQGRNIIIDQGDNNVAGYSDFDDGLYTSVPVVVFGDHTRIVKYVDRPFFIGADGVKILKPQKGVNPLYAFYALKAAHIDSLGYSRHFKLVKELTFALADTRMQRRIAGELDKICELKKNAETRLEKLDLLVKSRFVEMFGDPVANPKRWEVRAIGEFADVRIGPFGSLLHKEDYVEGGHPLINPSHMVDGHAVPDMNLTLSDSKYRELEPYHLMVNDVVIARRGEIGRCALIEDNGLFCGTGSMFVRVRTNCRADYLQRVISYPTYSAQLEASAVGVTMKNINAGMIERSLIPLPPLTLQREFAAFVEKVDKLKGVAKKSVEQMDVLYRAKLQEYFG